MNFECLENSNVKDINKIDSYVKESTCIINVSYADRNGVLIDDTLIDCIASNKGYSVFDIFVNYTFSSDKIIDVYFFGDNHLYPSLEIRFGYIINKIFDELSKNDKKFVMNDVAIVDTNDELTKIQMNNLIYQFKASYSRYKKSYDIDSINCIGFKKIPTYDVLALGEKLINKKSKKKNKKDKNKKKGKK